MQYKFNSKSQDTGYSKNNYSGVYTYLTSSKSYIFINTDQIVLYHFY